MFYVVNTFNCITKFIFHWHKEGRSTEAKKKKKKKTGPGLSQVPGDCSYSNLEDILEEKSAHEKNCPPIPQNLNHCGILGIRIFINMLDNSHIQLSLKHCDIAKITW